MQGIRKRNAIIVAIILPLTCYIFFSFTGKMYGYSDNLMVAVVSAGMYGENNFCQYLHPALCLIIKCLNPIFPTVDIFTTIVHMSILCGAISDADYYLQYHISHSEFSPEKEEAARTPMEEMFSNEFFTLYKIVTGEEEIVSPDMDGAGYEN